jgi:hypothetical protein
MLGLYDHYPSLTDPLGNAVAGWAVSVAFLALLAWG